MFTSESPSKFRGIVSKLNLPGTAGTINYLKYVEKYVPFVNTGDLFETMRQEKPKENLRSTGDKQSVAIV